MIEMKVVGMTMDPEKNMPVIVLKSKTKEKILPIWIGIFEATSIAMKLNGIESPRPLTHDLLKSVIEKLNAKVIKIIINDLKNNTFYAKILFKTSKRKFNIDCRPSDAIALALRTGAPIFVEEGIILSVSRRKDKVELKSLLESLNEEDFGKYQM